MALGITITPLRSPSGSLFKGRKLKQVRFAGDAAKPAAGYTVTAAQLNLRLIEKIIIGPSEDGNLLWAASINTTVSSSVSTNQMTLQAYTGIGSAATATLNDTLCSTNVVHALVIGV